MIVEINRDHVLSIVAALDAVAKNQCLALTDAEFTFHIAYALALITRIYLEHPECTNKSPANLSLCMQDVVSALGKSMEFELKKLLADIAAGKVK